MEGADKADGREEQDGGRHGRDSRLQGGGEGAEDSVLTVAASPQSDSQDQVSPQLNDVTPESHPDLSIEDESSPEGPTSVQENVSAELLHFSNLYISEDMEEQEGLQGDEEEEEEQEEEAEEEEEEEDFLVLAPEHPLFRTRNAAIKRMFQRRKERLDVTLKEKLEMQKADAKQRQDINCQLYYKLEHLGRLQKKLNNCLEAKKQAEDKHRQTQEQLGATISRDTTTTKQRGEVQTIVSRLQKELDHLSQSQLSAQKASEDVSSQVQTMRNVTRKAAAERAQAEEQKVKQDLYVERLTKELERLTEQKAMYEAQISAQAEETQAAKESLSEADMDMDILMMAYKQLVHQWNNSLFGMRRQDEAFNAMQEAVREVEHQVVLLQREIEGYKKSTAEEEEQNETLTVQLRWSEMDCAASKKLISQKQAQREALQAHYSTCLCTLQETERILETLTKETSVHQAELKDQRKQKEKKSSARLELENKIMTHLQQQLTHTNTAKYTKRLTGKMAALRLDKMIQVQQQENEVLAAIQASQQVDQEMGLLALTQEALDEKIAEQNELLTSDQKTMSSFITAIEQNQATITNCNKKISQIVANTAQEDLSPMHIKIHAIMAQTEELAASVKSDKQLWMNQQEVLVGLTQEIEANSREMLKLQTESTAMHQKKIRLDSQIESEHQEQAELQLNSDVLHRDRVKLGALISKNRRLNEVLEQENVLMETDIIGKLKEAERESILLQMKHEKMQEDQELFLKSLLEVEQQVMLWEKKTQLMMETNEAVDTDVGKEEMKIIRADIHQMEVRLNQLMKQQGQLMRESEATVERLESILQRGETAPRGSHKKQVTKDSLNLSIQGLQREIWDTNKLVTESVLVIKELQQEQVALGHRLAQQRHRLTEQYGTGCILDSKQANLHDSKDAIGARLVLLQIRFKKLQKVREGSYQASSTSECVETALQEQTEYLHTASTVLDRVCEESPQHQGELRRLSQVLAANTESLTLSSFCD